jgi:hypothetical protein
VLTAHFYILTILRTGGAVPPLPQCLHDKQRNFRFIVLRSTDTRLFILRFCLTAIRNQRNFKCGKNKLLACLSCKETHTLNSVVWKSASYLLYV